MPYGNHSYSFTNSFPVNNDEDNEVELWHDHYQPHYVPTQQSAINSYQMFDQSPTYTSPTTYDSERVHRIAGRRINVGATPSMEPRVIQYGSSTESSSGFNTYHAERPVHERSQTIVEVRTQATRSSRRYYCEVEDCKDPTTGLRSSVSRRADLRRHNDSVHGKAQYDCKYPRCMRKGEEGFCRPDHYRDHLRGYHNEEVPKQERRRNS